MVVGGGKRAYRTRRRPAGDELLGSGARPPWTYLTKVALTGTRDCLASCFHVNVMRRGRDYSETCGLEATRMYTYRYIRKL